MAAKKKVINKGGGMPTKAFRFPADLNEEVRKLAAKHGMNESTFMRWAIANTARMVREGKLVPPVMRPDRDTEGEEA